MYRFVLNGTECQCETAEELRAAVGEGPVRRPVKKRAYKKRTTKKAKKVPTKKKRTSSQQGYKIADLPYVERKEGGITWAVVKKVAKKYPEVNQRQLRIDLKKRQEMGE
jgi:hypothetical protein